MAIVVNNLFGQGLTKRQRIEKKETVTATASALIGVRPANLSSRRAAFSNCFQIFVEVAQLLAHAATQVTVDVDRQVKRIDILRKEIARQRLRTFPARSSNWREHQISCACRDRTADILDLCATEFLPAPEHRSAATSPRLDRPLPLHDERVRTVQTKSSFAFFMRAC